MQVAAVMLGATVVQFEMPPSDDEVLPGLPWGLVEAFPTPAYWMYQVLARRVTGRSLRYKLGRTLEEEVAACLLGGHGIPASVGVAAFRALQSKGLFSGPTAEAQLFEELSKPIETNGRAIRYRFARQKARYLAIALDQVHRGGVPIETGAALRNWLLELPGIGPKTASWIARNWLDADDVAILDIHILRAGALAGFFAPGLTVERHYFELERQFLAFSRAMEVRPSELDAVIWFEMMSSTATVRRLLGARAAIQKESASGPGTNEGRANAH